MEQIRQYFEQSLQLADEEWALFSSKLIVRELPKKELILKSGQTENYLSFIEEGVIRFYLPGETDDLTFSFAFKNNFVSAYDSFLLRRPSLYSVETLTKTKLWRMSYKDLQEIYLVTSIGNTIGRKAAEELFIKKSKREISLLNETAEERYLKLFIEQPRLIEEVPLKFIASYIGVTPQALSRIRARIS